MINNPDMDIYPAMQQKHIVSVSSGAPSALLAFKVIATYGAENVVCLFADTGVEDDDNYRFLYDLQKAGLDILFVSSGKTPEDLQLEQNTLYTQVLAPCTRILKLEPIRAFVQTMQGLGYLVHMHVGYTSEDKSRMEDTRRNWIANGVIPHFLLADLTRHHVKVELKAHGLTLPASYNHHFPNANCLKQGGCVKGGKSYMLRVLTHYPQAYAKREALEAMIRYRQYKRQRAQGVRVADVKLYTQLRDANSPTGHITLKRFREQYEQSLQSQPMLKLFTFEADGDVCGAECGVSNPGVWVKAS